MKKTPLVVAGLMMGASLLPIKVQAQTPGMTPMVPSMAPGTTPMASGTLAPMPMLAPMDELFAGRAAEGNLAEINAANLALRKSKNESVRMVAQTIIKGHSQAQAELTSVAPRKGMLIPSMVSPTHMAVMARLEKAKGDAFDKLYISNQLDEHENTIALFSNEVSMGEDADLKAHATKYLPDIVGHTVMIYNVARQIKAPGIEMRPAMPPTPPGVVVPDMSSMSMMPPAPTR